MTPVSLTARSLVPGQVSAPLLWTDVPLSFWGGIDPASGTVIDHHHPLQGSNVTGRVLALPDARGSCTGSTVMLELLLGDFSPAGLILVEADEILTLGVLVAERLFGRSIPVLQLDAADFAQLATFSGQPVRIANASDTAAADDTGLLITAVADQPAPIALDVPDRACLAGERGEAVQVAMRILLRMAEITGATQLIDITRAHIDACIYTGPASLRFARRLLAMGARFVVPTTLNAISVDRCNWRAQGVPPSEAEPADALAQTYLDMGARESFTCAPYHLPGAPALDEQIAWAESNAVAYANSVLGARTAKYPDFLEILAALTGRVPAAGCHLDAPRQPVLRLPVDAPAAGAISSDFYAVLGYAVGLRAGRRVVLLEGLEQLTPSDDELRAFCAAFATTSSAPLVHIAGITPEARAGRIDAHALATGERIDRAALAAAWAELNGAGGGAVSAMHPDLIALGNPHFSADEFAELARLCRGRRASPEVKVVVATSRHVHDLAERAGDLQPVRDFGALIVRDTCWCMLREPVVPVRARVIATTSAKYAHYAAGLVGRVTRLASLAECVQAACCGLLSITPPVWLDAAAYAPPCSSPAENGVRI